ncbi:hypothetical protein NE237_003169 [Protea cynaroides]|uniref:Uncharacterized protein n=1 Tax=Protea cynaroides TaxID=273540 RepID=A0A9Q0KGK6_9MAGN|nr:hypothetical protein NE237_003169 [Protea cynaroides]
MPRILFVPRPQNSVKDHSRTLLGFPIALFQSESEAVYREEFPIVLLPKLGCFFFFLILFCRFQPSIPATTGAGSGCLVVGGYRSRLVVFQLTGNGEPSFREQLLQWLIAIGICSCVVLIVW